MRLLITGHSGFIGRHLKLPLADNSKKAVLEDIFLPNRFELDVFSTNAAQTIIQEFQPSHVLHLAWTSTSDPGYDFGDIHESWAQSTFAVALKLSNAGIVSWCVGTGLEVVDGFGNTPYGAAKSNLKNWVLAADDDLIRWISMPYVFSLFHRRPRIIDACLEGQELRSKQTEVDYLEIRDVAHQISKIVTESDQKLNSVSSYQKISNLDFCRGINRTVTSQLATDCSCRGNSVYDPLQSDTQFTSLLLA
jgi:nucleoside-diphosphate-sugar epimerase